MPKHLDVIDGIVILIIVLSSLPRQLKHNISLIPLMFSVCTSIYTDSNRFRSECSEHDFNSTTFIVQVFIIDFLIFALEHLVCQTILINDVTADL